MSNHIETRSLAALKQPYFIPAYQRGYRWTHQHVQALLDDIDSFAKHETEADDYCLQPVVVVPPEGASGETSYEVVDGQQRLITLYLILKYLKNEAAFSFSFEKRTKSDTFLKDLSSETLSDENPDFHFISEAYRCIADWFKGKNEDERTTFLKVLNDRVKVIWYEIALVATTHKAREAEKIDIFNRLNIGKIPLEDAELIRALLMSQAEGITPRERLFRQALFSNEWYEIEHALREDDFWYFFGAKEPYENRIQWLLERLFDRRNPKPTEANLYALYQWFETEVKGAAVPWQKVKELWDEVLRIFQHCRYWYTERTLYHYIGFLLSVGRIRLKELLEWSLAKDKDTFKNLLQQRIITFLNDTPIEELSYDSDKANVQHILLLFNVLSVLQQPLGGRFSFYQYNSQQWSLEHIHAQQSENPLQSDKAIKAWAKETLEAIGNIQLIEKETSADDKVVDTSSFKEALKEILSQEKVQDVKAFNELKNNIIAAFESPSVHYLDNMALLSKRDNSALNNAIFPAKRNHIIRLEREGRFIPLCTRNVFLKLYSPADQQPYYWSQADREHYLAAIKAVFENFKESTND